MAMENQIPEIIEELYQTYGSEQVQRGYPPRPSDVPHGLWAFYQGLLVGVQLLPTNACPASPASPHPPHRP